MNIYIFIFLLLFTRSLWADSINWSDKISQETLVDSWLTWNDHYRKKLHPSIDQKKFYQAVQFGYFKTVTIKELLDMGMENHRFKRYSCLTAEDAYPPHDRPRNNHDIESVNYHVTTNDLISPVIIARVTDVHNITHLIKLDGMHRLVAAAIRNSPVRAFFIDLGQATRLKKITYWFTRMLK